MNAPRACSKTTSEPLTSWTLRWKARRFFDAVVAAQGQAAAAFWVHRLRREAGKESPKLERRKTLTFAAVKYGTLNANYNLILTMDRSVGNMLEQTPPFLLALWLHALTASAADAAWFGWLWLMLRALYPFAFAHPSMSLQVAALSTIV